MDVNRKSRVMSRRHLPEPPQSIIYSSLVSKDLVQILPDISALNDFDVRFLDIQNAYPTAETDLKLNFNTGMEFALELGGCTAVIMRSIYVLNYVGLSFHKHLKTRLGYLGYRPCLFKT